LTRSRRDGEDGCIFKDVEAIDVELEILLEPVYLGDNVTMVAPEAVFNVEGSPVSELPLTQYMTDHGSGIT